MPPRTLASLRLHYALAVVMLAACTDAGRPAAPAGPAPAAPAPVAAPVDAPAEAPPAPAAPAPASPPAPNATGESIGSARMEADGTIVLQLRAEGGGAIGDALLRYPPDHAQYASIKDHVGPIEPGQERPVAPFPPPAGTWRYRVLRSHEELGVIEVRPGEVGTLTLTSESEGAKRLAELWRKVEAERSFSISMHMPTSDGSRGPLGARMYRVGDDDYAEAVRWKLLDANYDVGVLAGAKE